MITINIKQETIREVEQAKECREMNQSDRIKEVNLQIFLGGQQGNLVDRLEFLMKEGFIFDYELLPEIDGMPGVKILLTGELTEVDLDFKFTIEDAEK